MGSINFEAVSGDIIGFKLVGLVKPPKAHGGNTLIVACPKQAWLNSSKTKALAILKIGFISGRNWFTILRRIMGNKKLR
jgi:hypothetical protein